jgi:hypothetical protein
LNNLSVPESVKHDPANGQIYISNIYGDPSARDHRGFISRVSMDGKFAEMNWVQGLDAPKGMGIYQGHLFVTDIDEIVEIDIGKSKIVNHYPVKSSVFLNDLDIDRQGNIYFTDSGTGILYRMKDGKIESLLKNTTLNKCNGLCCDNDYLFVGTADGILKIQPQSDSISVVASDTGPVDGLKCVISNVLIYSDWQGKVFIMDKDGSKKCIIDTSPDKINAADIEYIPSMGMLCVPTFFNNRVVAYQINEAFLSSLR